MEIEVFTLCDAATDTYGKLNILGAFDTLMASTFPVVHAQCAIAVRIRYRRIEAGQHRLLLHLVDEDGHMILPAMDGTVTVAVPAGQASVVTNLVLQVQGLTLERIGEYALNLAIDGRQVASLPLFVRQIQQQA